LLDIKKKKKVSPIFLHPKPHTI